jgi:imidazolonepropionase-like amidohydrolase
MNSRRTRALRLLCPLGLALAFILPFALRTEGRRQQDSTTQARAGVALAVVGATVVDGTGRAPFRGTVLVSADGRIAAVGENVAAPEGARVVRAEGQTLLPGLFDLHTHLPYATAGGLSGDWPKNLKAYLYSGVTSVVEFGTYPETFEPMRRLISAGVVQAPRIHYAARFSTPGGHGAEGGRPDFFTLEAQTPRAARAAFRRVLPYKPDVIKVFTDGWRYNAAPDMTSMNEETLAALVEEAHEHGVEVLTHTVTLERAKQAARAGVDVIAHGVGDRPVDEELINLMRGRGTTYVSTLAVYEPRGRDILTPLLSAVLEPAAREQIQPPLTHAPSGGEIVGVPPPTVSEARRARWANLMHNVGALKAGGVRFGAGTDAGVTGTHHGWATLRELRLLVAGGLTPLQAITAATLDSAKALRVEHERGSIEVGKLADLLLVEGEPHRRIADVERVSRVFLGGVEIDRERLAREIAAPGVTPLPAVKLGALVDDFEGAASLSHGEGARPAEGRDAKAGDGVETRARGGNTARGAGDAPAAHDADALRSRLGTLWVNGAEGGHDNTRMVFGRTLRRGRDHALSLVARMSTAERPYARVSVPLTRGAVEPADARGWRGVRFDVRGDGGEYLLVVPTRSARDSNFFQSTFNARPEWRTVRIDFSSLKRQRPAETPAAWTGADLLMLTFEAARPPGSIAWLELDNIRFYR